jgi:hypothetical protein
MVSLSQPCGMSFTIDNAVGAPRLPEEAAYAGDIGD